MQEYAKKDLQKNGEFKYNILIACSQLNIEWQY
jgi:hypothetical protein